MLIGVYFDGATEGAGAAAEEAAASLRAEGKRAQVRDATVFSASEREAFDGVLLIGGSPDADAFAAVRAAYGDAVIGAQPAAADAPAAPRKRGRPPKAREGAADGDEADAD